MKKNLGREGFGLIEVVVAAALMSVVAVSFSGLLTNTFNQEKRIDVKEQLRNIAITYRDAIADAASWNASVSSQMNATDTVMSLGGGGGVISAPSGCLNLPAVGCVVPTTQFTVYLNGLTDQSGNIHYGFSAAASPSNLTNGFSMDSTGRFMNQCNNFVMPGGSIANALLNPQNGTGNDSCPFSAIIAVSVRCPAVGSCPSPNLSTRVAILYNPGPVGMRRLGVRRTVLSDTAQIPGTGTVSSPSGMCASFNGVWDAANNRCLLKNQDTDSISSPPPACAQGEFLQRQAGTNILTCTSDFRRGASCPGQILQGYGLDGNPICGPAPAAPLTPPTCSAGQALTFNGTSYSCMPAGVPHGCVVVRNDSLGTVSGINHNFFAYCPAGTKAISGGGTCFQDTLLSTEPIKSGGAADPYYEPGTFPVDGANESIGWATSCSTSRGASFAICCSL